MQERALLLSLIDEAFNARAWHGPTLRGSLRRVALEQAVWRPGPDRHNIWEIAVHAAYWKYVVRRRFTGEKRGSFPLKGSNWFTRDQTNGADQWKQDLRLLDETHNALRQMVETVTKKQLQAIPTGAKVSGAEVLRGIALHDVYHAGQIQLLKKQCPV